MSFIKGFILIFIISNTIIWGGGCSAQKEVFANTDKTVKTKPNNADPEISSAEKQIETNPNSAKENVQLALIYLKRARETGDFSLNSKAENAVAKALEIEPDNLEARKLKASLHLIFHRASEALEAAKKLNAEFPNDDFVYGILIDANIELGNYKEAAENAQKMVDLKPGVSSYIRVAQLRSLHGDFNGASEMFKTAVRLADSADKESQSRALVELGDELRKNGKYAEAEKSFDDALQSLPNYYSAIAGKARIRAAQNDFETALKLLSDANDRAQNVETTILLGDIYTKQGFSEKAQQQYDLVEVIVKQNNINDQKRLALLWADHDVRLDEALAISKHESELQKDIFTNDVLAWCLYKKGQLTDAKTAITKALSLKSSDARILYHAGMIEKDLGNAKEAKELLQQALKINPMFDLVQSEKAQKALSELK